MICWWKLLLQFWFFLMNYELNFWIIMRSKYWNKCFSQHFFQCIRSMWCLIYHLILNPFPHWSHLNGFSSVCVCRWASKRNIRSRVECNSSDDNSVTVHLRNLDDKLSIWMAYSGNASLHEMLSCSFDWIV